MPNVSWWWLFKKKNLVSSLYLKFFVQFDLNLLRFSGNWLKKPIEQDQFPLLSNEKWLISLKTSVFSTFFPIFKFLDSGFYSKVKITSEISTKNNTSGSICNNNYLFSKSILIKGLVSLKVLALGNYFLE